MGDCYDVAVIGGGAAGLSAALVLGRARRAVAFIDAGHPRNAPAAEMHGYLSRDGMPAQQLLAAGRAEVARYGVTLVEGVVAGRGLGSLGPGLEPELLPLDRPGSHRPRPGGSRS